MSTTQRRPVTLIAVVTLLAVAPGLSRATTVDFGLFEQVAPIGNAAATPAPPAEGVMLLQFWASWCHSCGALMWDMDEIVSGNEGVSYLAVSLDDDAEAARQYVRKHALYEKYASRYFIDGDKALATSLGVETVPSVLVVSPEGEVLLHKTGHLNATDLRDIAGAVRPQL